MKSQSGFSLIEALVAGIISVIIPGVLIALLGVNNSEMARNSARSRLGQISNAVSDDIRSVAMRADRVFDATLVTPPNCPAAPIPPVGSGYNAFDSVAFCDTNGVVSKSYRIKRLSPGIGRLDERIGAGPWKPFVIGSDTVKVDMDVDPYNQKLGGLFGVENSAQFLYFNFHYHMDIGGTASTLPMQNESFVCRNSVSRLW